ncbi:MAG: hypothetical protein D6696_17055 [Acidobacteria bacterium]|nr:MAG: hypothetical protein D6696_17055 [Acidobacteriota bacterium]
MSERKYRQRGYQDEDNQRPQRRPGPPRGARPGPRGRGLGKPTANVFRCAVCGAKQPTRDVKLTSQCKKCGADLHTCTHCTHFDTSARWQCRQPIEQPVKGKAKRNECSLFVPKTTQEFARDARRPPSGSSNDARAAFDALFKI